MGRMFAALAVLTLYGTPLHAQEQPWCVKLDTFTKNCDFATYQACMTIANNATGPATGASSCIRNPDYKAPATAAAHVKPAPNKPAPAKNGAESLPH
jgi:hypothetical protein